MSDEPTNIILVYLRRIDEKVEKLVSDSREFRERLGLIEGQYASISRRVDAMDLRLERIERRLDIVHA